MCKVSVNRVLSLFFVFGLSLIGVNSYAREKTNILLIFIDDMGYGDLGCYGNQEVHTPNIDLLAKEGVRFNQFYVNSPICSPSRVAITTGQYPSRWGITSYISGKADNKERGMNHCLNPLAPSLARNLKAAGYYTAHIGKWHMGGGRDMADVPMITEYGFDESVTQFEGLGERYLATYETLNLQDSTRGLEKQSAALGKGEIHWAKRENFTQIFVDRTLQAIQHAKAAGKPFYINLWPDDIHTPLEPPLALRGDLSTKARFLGVMQEMDRQMGRLFDFLRKDSELLKNTLVVFTSDNGPDMAVNNAAPLRGFKTYLYDGGIREPFIVWWPAEIDQNEAGTINEKTVMAAIDLPLTFMEVAGAEPDPGVKYDGQSMLEALKGDEQTERTKPLFWIRPPDRPGYDGENNPDLAIRSGDYKLLMDVDGTNVQLYNLMQDIGESDNLAGKMPEVAAKLKDQLTDWYRHYPHDVDKTKY